MKNKGFILLEIMVGLFLIGLISMTCLPILNLSKCNFNKIKEKNEMIYIGEMVIEKLKTKDEISLSFLRELESHEIVEYTDNDIDSDKYICTINKISDNGKFIEIRVKVSKIDQEDSPIVQFKTGLSKQ